MSDLFDHSNTKNEYAPLAERMRPRSIDELIGQDHLVGPGKFLSTLIQRDQIPSLILWGPPGVGKTTIASIIAHHTRSEFVFYSAILGGVKEIRAIAEEARNRQKFNRRRTILFVDEIHRFNKSQQDAFLPFVEKGIVTLIGATVENPSFEVNAALLSRSKVLLLHALEAEDLARLIKRALADSERGLGRLELEMDDKSVTLLAESSYGDARRALTTLETAADIALQNGKHAIDEETVVEAMQHKMLLYDKKGEEHYNLVSAFIKSMRGSDPDAAVYWMTRMLEAGEDPLFILRRMVIFASEDIGNADPQALQTAVAATESFRFIGLPEGVLPMSQAAVYLACAPKANSSYMAYLAARKDVKEFGALPVPLHVRNAPTALMKSIGYGNDYKYPHNYDGHYVPEQYLPEKLKDRLYFSPSDQGREKEIAERLEKLREQAGKKLKKNEEE